MNTAHPKCITCGQSTASKRSDAKYCSDRCRMRHRRDKISKSLRNQLIQICSQIPNHVVHYANRLAYIVIRDAKRGNYIKVDVKTLNTMADKELRDLIRRKKEEVKVFQITKVVNKWLDR